MVVLNRIYTRTGDDGTTSLGTGARRKKCDLRVEAYGTVDEVNAVIGLVRLHATGDKALDAALGRIQNDLFDVEADLCLAEKGPGGARLTVTDAQVAWLETEIDRLNGELTPLKSFILPGGSPASAYLHLARTVCRRIFEHDFMTTPSPVTAVDFACMRERLPIKRFRWNAVAVCCCDQQSVC